MNDKLKPCPCCGAELMAIANSLDAAIGAMEIQAFQENTTLAGTVKEVASIGMKVVEILRKKG